MNKKTLRIITIVSTVVLMLSICSLSFATTPANLTPSGESNEVLSVGARIMGVIQTVGIVVSVIVLMVLGIKYMMGSAEEKAEYKKTFIPYIIGAILLFAASTIANVVYNFATTIKGNNL